MIPVIIIGLIAAKILLSLIHYNPSIIFLLIAIILISIKYAGLSPSALYLYASNALVPATNTDTTGCQLLPSLYEYNIYNKWLTNLMDGNCDKDGGGNTYKKYAPDIHIIWDRMHVKLMEFQTAIYKRDGNIHLLLADIIQLENALATLFSFISESDSHIITLLTQYNTTLNTKLLSLYNRCTWMPHDMSDLTILPANL